MTTASAPHRWITLVAVLGGPICAGCASSGGGTSDPARERDRFTVFFRADAIPVRRVTRAPVEAVWAVVPQVFEGLGYPGGASVYEGERVYLTPNLKIEKRLYEGDLNSLYLDCGRTAAGVPAADVYAVTFAILTRVTPQDSARTIVEVIIDGTARDQAERSSPVSCAGTGRLETVILQRIEAGVRSATPGTSEPG
jgi:hypothetical protein